MFLVYIFLFTRRFFFLKYFKQMKSATILMVRFISRQGLSHVSWYEFETWQLLLAREISYEFPSLGWIACLWSDFLWLQIKGRGVHFQRKCELFNPWVARETAKDSVVEVTLSQPLHGGCLLTFAVSFPVRHIRFFDVKLKKRLLVKLEEDGLGKRSVLYWHLRVLFCFYFW